MLCAVDDGDPRRETYWAVGSRPRAAVHASSIIKGKALPPINAQERRSDVGNEVENIFATDQSRLLFVWFAFHLRSLLRASADQAFIALHCPISGLICVPFCEHLRTNPCPVRIVPMLSQ
jgi:hypothetical protein